MSDQSVSNGSINGDDSAEVSRLELAVSDGVSEVSGGANLSVNRRSHWVQTALRMGRFYGDKLLDRILVCFFLADTKSSRGADTQRSRKVSSNRLRV